MMRTYTELAHPSAFFVKKALRCEQAHALLKQNGRIGYLVPRADLPEGLILNRDATQFILETEIEDIALPVVTGQDSEVESVKAILDKRKRFPQLGPTGEQL